MTFKEWWLSDTKNHEKTFIQLFEEYSKIKAEQSARKAVDFVFEFWNHDYKTNCDLKHAAIQHAISEGTPDNFNPMAR